jgi:hypothetical protein
MAAGVHLLEPAEFDAGVNLGRRNRRMPQHFLDGPEVRPTGQQVSREAVSQGMWADRPFESRGPGMQLHDPPEAHARERAARPRHEHGLGLGVPSDHRGTIVLQVIGDGRDRP